MSHVINFKTGKPERDIMELQPCIYAQINNLAVEVQRLDQIIKERGSAPLEVCYALFMINQQILEMQKVGM
jgi:hypothetical protein